MTRRETLLGLLVLAAVLGGVLWARGRGRGERAPAAPGGVAGTAGATGATGAATAAGPEGALPDVTLADGSVEVGGVRLVLSAERPILAFSKVRWRARAESGGAPVALEDGRLSFEMTMPMGDHRYALLPGAGGWQEAEVVLPMCRSGSRTWFATLEGKVGGKPVSSRFRLELSPPPEEPAPAATPAAR